MIANMLALTRIRPLAAGVAAAVAIVISPLTSLPVSAQELPSIANLAERLLPAVVDISVTQKAEGDGDQNLPMPDLGPNSPFREFFDDFFKRRQQGEGP